MDGGLYRKAGDAALQGSPRVGSQSECQFQIEACRLHHLVKWDRHSGGSNYAFADGHAKWLSKAYVFGNWTTHYYAKR